MLRAISPKAVRCTLSTEAFSAFGGGTYDPDRWVFKPGVRTTEQNVLLELVGDVVHILHQPQPPEHRFEARISVMIFWHRERFMCGSRRQMFIWLYAFRIPGVGYMLVPKQLCYFDLLLSRSCCRSGMPLARIRHSTCPQRHAFQDFKLENKMQGRLGETLGQVSLVATLPEPQVPTCCQPVTESNKPEASMSTSLLVN